MKSVAARFWPKVKRAGPDECWLWTASRSTGGYGRFHYGPGTQWHNAQRISWILERGPIPDGLFVLHMCDTRLCVNPAHLFLGTHRDNVFDAVRKGRYSTPAKGQAMREVWRTNPRVRAIRLKNLRTDKRRPFCEQGHAMEGYNLLIVSGRRSCRACKVADTRAWRSRHRATHCKNGHLLNTLNVRGRRYCPTCQRAAGQHLKPRH